MSKKELSRAGIYAIVNTTNGKAYVGSAVDIYKRWSSHKSLLRRGRHDSHILQRAWNKYGEDVWEWRVLEYCDLGDLGTRESYWMTIFGGYNIRSDVSRNIGLQHSDETKAKISASKRGVSHVGHPHSEETKAKISAAKKGRPQSLESNLKRSSTMQGMQRSAVISTPNNRRPTLEQRIYIGQRRSTITNDVIASIDEMLKDGHSQKIIAIRLGVNQSTVSRVKNRQLTRIRYESDPDPDTTPAP